jgi:hypothetical protein
VIKAKENRDVMTCDIPNTFTQAYLPKKEPGEDRVMMKITGVLVDMLVNRNPELYGPVTVLENCKKVPKVEVLNAIYGMLEAALLWYKTFRKDLEDIGFVSTHTTHAWEIRRFKDCNRRLYFMWTT